MHTAEEMRAISDLAHQVEGLILAAAALLAIAERATAPREGALRTAWSALILLSGVFLLGYLLIPHHGLEHAESQWSFVFSDPQQRQHVILAALATLGGGAEVLVRSGRLRGDGWYYVWPVTVALAGVLFLAHPQHGTTAAVLYARRIHQGMGLAFLVTAVLRAGELLRVRPRAAPAYGWRLSLLAAAVLMFLYREPPGAYHGAEGVEDPPSPRTSASAEPGVSR